MGWGQQGLGFEVWQRLQQSLKQHRWGLRGVFCASQTSPRNFSWQQCGQGYTTVQHHNQRLSGDSHYTSAASSEGSSKCNTHLGCKTEVEIVFVPWKTSVPSQCYLLISASPAPADPFCERISCSHLAAPLLPSAGAPGRDQAALQWAELFREPHTCRPKAFTT